VSTNDVNRSAVTVNLRDVKGKTIRDDVDIKFYNQRGQSLNQMFSAQFEGRPVNLRNGPAGTQRHNSSAQAGTVGAGGGPFFASVSVIPPSR
jgi:hypothetical protein